MEDYTSGGTTANPPKEICIILPDYPGFRLVVPEDASWYDIKRMANKLQYVIKKHAKDNYGI